MRKTLNIILLLSAIVWIYSITFNTITHLWEYHSDNMMDTASYSFTLMLLLGLEKMATTENKTKDSVKSFFSKEARNEQKKLKAENKGKGCGCKK